jgi:hypothetical protein
MSNLDIVAKLKTAEECATFEKNVSERGDPDLVLAARKRAIELRAQAHGARTLAERECLEAVYAYERVLSANRGKNVRASRTWQMIDRHGIIRAVERVVTRRDDAPGFRALTNMGLQNYAFEAVVLRHPAAFSPQALTRSKARLDAHQKA